MIPGKGDGYKVRMDLHTHAKWSKNIAFSYDYFRNMMKEAGKCGLDAIALTEHFNTLSFYEIYETLDRHCSHEGDHYKVEGVKVFPGIEVDVREKGHILVIGARSTVNEIRMRLEDHLTEDNYIEAARLLDMSDQYSCIRIGAHPFRKANPLYSMERELLHRLNAFDLNGRDLHHYGLGMEAKVNGLANSIGIPVVAGSDTHQPLQFGSVYNKFEQSCDTIDQLRNAIGLGYGECHIAHDLHTKVRSAEAEQARYKANRESVS